MYYIRKKAAREKAVPHMKAGNSRELQLSGRAGDRGNGKIGHNELSAFRRGIEKAVHVVPLEKIVGSGRLGGIPEGVDDDQFHLHPCGENAFDVYAGL